VADGKLRLIGFRRLRAQMDFSIGLGLVLLAGAMNGSFAVPMKYATRWSWENIWLAWAFLALVAMPLILTLSTVPNLGRIYSASPATALRAVIGFGAGWGIAQVLFGLGIDLVGVAVGFAIVVGLAGGVGTLVPLLVFQRARVMSSSGLAAIAGVIVLAGGVTLCAIAGKRKAEAPTSSGKPSLSQLGILFCVLAGVGGSMVNLGLAFGAPLLDEARRNGVTSSRQANLVWLPLVLAGFVSIAIYCARLLSIRHTWNRFFDRSSQSYWLLAFLMAVLWLGSVEIYGIAAGRLGSWGPVLGWPVFMSCSIVTANIWGLFTGEWEKAPAASRRLMLVGVAVIVGAIFVVGFAGRLA
jgi:L-rhamnose-H+ transport protein